VEDARRTVDNQYAHLPVVRRFELNEHFRASRLGARRTQQANYINELADSISPIFEPAGPLLGELFFPPWVNFFMTLGEIFKSGRC
jgi:hypothetical protein